jgi:hypothetical protein
VKVEQAYVLEVYVCLTTSEGEAKIRVESECLSHME